MSQVLELKSPRNETVRANYNKLSDHIRRLTPQGIQCSVFCGGEKCKYENPENWRPDSLAIHGIYSHWWEKLYAPLILICTQCCQQVNSTYCFPLPIHCSRKCIIYNIRKLFYFYCTFNGNRNLDSIVMIFLTVI